MSAFGNETIFVCELTMRCVVVKPGLFLEDAKIKYGGIPIPTKISDFVNNVGVQFPNENMAMSVSPNLRSVNQNLLFPKWTK